jgi:methylmalonyl-CoA mutase N-terminal domain/subunit
LEILRISHEVERDQRAVLARRRESRDDSAVQAALGRLVAAAGTEDNLIPPMLAAAEVEATLGEICGALREVWGSYTEPARF